MQPTRRHHLAPRSRNTCFGGLLLWCVCIAACSSGPDTLVLVGSLERTQVEMVAPIGETIADIGVRRGQRVERGDVLLRLDPTLARADLARAEAELAGARTSDRVATLELARLTKLREQRVASAQALERAELGRDEAASRLRAAQAGLAASRKRLRDLDLVAPRAGVIDQLPYEAGERVPAGAVLVVLLSEDAPWVRVWVPERHVVHVRPGGRASITIDGVGPEGSPRALDGEVIDVAREPGFTPHYALTERERVHLVYETRVEVTNAPRELRPGVPATVRLELTPALLAADDEPAVSSQP